MKNVIAIGILFSTVVQADIVCLGETAFGPTKIKITQDKVKISGAALEGPMIYTAIQAQWDGHKTELITASGLSISYENWYGCIHNAKVTANFRTFPRYFETVEIPQCSGGETSDSACHVH